MMCRMDLIIYKLISNIGLKITLWYKITDKMIYLMKVKLNISLKKAQTELLSV